MPYKNSDPIKQLLKKRFFADYFAGIGLVSLGLENAGWKCIFAVDHSDEKREMYEGHFGKGHYQVQRIDKLSITSIPDVTLAHASFPCTNLSVAGGREGLNGVESSAYWDFVEILKKKGNKRPPLIMLENVDGLITSDQGKDLHNAMKSLCELGYTLDMMVIDASHFVPQSRVRVFITGMLTKTSQGILEQEQILQQHSEIRPERVKNFIRKHPDLRWYLQNLPPLPKLKHTINNIIDNDAIWWTMERSNYLFNQMNDKHKLKIEEFMSENKYTYATAFRRMRVRNGKKLSTAEIRFDGIAGCLRTPKGGSAKQIIIRAGFGKFDARHLNAMECARLMGAGNFRVPADLSENQILFGFGDAVCVPVITWLSNNCLVPMLKYLENDYETNCPSLI